MFNLNNNINTEISSIMKEISVHTEKIILEQLNDFISRGLIVIESTGPTLVTSFNSNKVEIKYSCRLVLKDKEYIEKLEKENAEMKEFLRKLKEVEG